MSMRFISKKFVIEFLDLYKSQECLWKNKSKDYHDKYKRQEAYNILAEKLRQIDPDATRETITRKIDSFRSCFRKELRKVKDSKEAGGPVYKPRLWYYDHMTFLIDPDEKQQTAQDTPGEPMELENDDNSQDTASISSASAEGTPFGAVCDPLPELVPTTTTNVQANPQEAPSAPQTPLTIRQVIYKKLPTENEPKEPAKSRSRSRKGTKENQKAAVHNQRYTEPLRISASDIFLEEEDEFDVMGKNIGNKLRKLPPERVMIVEKLITDLLFEAQTGESITQSTRFNLFDLRNSAVSF